MVSLPALEINSTVEIYVPDRLLNLKNGTFIYLQTEKKLQDNENELLYVVVVVGFYAMALMFLIATQLKKSKREGQEVDYYYEYLQRNSAIHQNKHMHQQMVQRVKKTSLKSAAQPPGGPLAVEPSVSPAKAIGIQLESIPDEDV